MRIKLLCNLGTNDFPETPFKDGEEHEVSDQLGRSLVAQRLAKDITPAAAPEAEPVVVKEEPKPEPVAEKPAAPVKAEPAKPAVTSKQSKA